MGGACPEGVVGALACVGVVVSARGKGEEEGEEALLLGPCRRTVAVAAVAATCGQEWSLLRWRR